MSPRLVSALAFVVLLSAPLAYAGCVGDEPVPTNGTPGVDGGGGGGGDGQDARTGEPFTDGGRTDLDPDATPPAGCPLGCLPPAPPGWTGPSAVYDGEPGSTPAACPSAIYTQLEVQAHQGMSAAPATCNCGTGQVQGASCSSDIEGWSGAGCTGAAIYIGTATSNGGCLVSGDGTSNYVKVKAGAISRGTCAYPSAQVTRPNPVFEKTNVACGLPQVGACQGRADCTATPLPEAPFTRICIHKAGDEACPSADYSKRYVAFKKVTDGRDCTTCAGAPSGGACGTAWGTSASTLACMSTAPTTNAAGACISNPGNGARFNIAAMGPSGITCSQTGGGTPTGQAVSEEPVSFCCNK